MSELRICNTSFSIRACGLGFPPPHGKEIGGMGNLGPVSQGCGLVGGHTICSRVS